MSTFRLSLRALGHPLSLVAIGVLLLNDHWLKANAPSTFTGKLSDFAGLFFFPFLLAALVAWPLRRFSARRVMALALGLTAIWFAAIKTLPLANALTVAALEAVLRVPVQIVLDPTDCAALVMLFPAWRLWVQFECAHPAPPDKRAFLNLGLATLATMATSPCPTTPDITRLAVDNGRVYARLDNWRGSDGAPFGVAVSTDGGRIWETTQTAPQVVSDTLQLKAIYPVVMCVPGNGAACYRLLDDSRIEESSDGGSNWKTAWQIPWGRIGFMQRMHQTVMSCYPEPNVSINDLVLAQTPTGFYIVAAMGNQGVVIRTNDGQWERHDVAGARPVPWTIEHPVGMLINLVPEISTSLHLALVLWLGLSVYFWSSIFTVTRRASSVAAFGWALAILVVIGEAFYISNIVQSLNKSSIETSAAVSLPLFYFGIALMGWPPIWLILFALFAILVIASSVVMKAAPNPAAASQIGHFHIKLVLGVLGLGWLPFALWAIGLIPLYEIAAALALALIIGLLVWAWSKMMRLRREALTPPAV